MTATTRILSASLLSMIPFALAADAPGADAEIGLTKVSLDQFRGRIAKSEPGVRYTIVDAWATYCPPCLENFPHLVEMHHKYGGQGLRAFSLTLDDPLEAEDVKKAESFLKEKGAIFPNFIIDGDPGEVYEYLEINAIPAVFVFGPDGKELKRFTLDDVDNQFTYEQVESYVKGLLAKPAE